MTELRVERGGIEGLRGRGPDPEVAEAVRGLIAEVREGGDDAVLAITRRFDRADLAPDELRVPVAEVEEALTTLEPGVLDALQTAKRNVERLAREQITYGEDVRLPEGQQIQVNELPVRRAAAYVPGGRAPYPSTVVMCAATAHVAGVGEIAVCAPPGPGGRAHPTILAACALCEVGEVYRMGGAQAIAALAYGTESVAPVDVIAGPGNAYVQEAKRQVAGVVGIDGVEGPTELVVVASGGADPELIALDLLAQGEHGPDSLLVAVSADEDLLDAVEEALRDLAAGRDTVVAERVLLVPAATARQAIEIADELAPEHVQVVGEEAEPLASRVHRAGAVFVGREAGAAFGDYVAGSNHVLPTGGAARFASGLSPSTFRRRMARVSFHQGAASKLAPAGAALARAEGFPVHGESMERRS